MDFPTTHKGGKFQYAIIELRNPKFAKSGVVLRDISSSYRKMPMPTLSLGGETPAAVGGVAGSGPGVKYIMRGLVGR